MSASAYYQRATARPSARTARTRGCWRASATSTRPTTTGGPGRRWSGPGRACRAARAAATHQHEIQGAKRRGKTWRTTTPDPDAARRPDPIQRQFRVEERNRLWVGDLSYLRCWKGVVYFAFVIDVFSRKVVGWQLASHLRTDLVLDALRMALGTREHGADFRLPTSTPAHAGGQPGPSPTVNHGRYLLFERPAARAQSAPRLPRRSTRRAGHVHRPVTSAGT